MLRKTLGYDKNLAEQEITSYPDLTDESVKFGSLNETAEQHDKSFHRPVIHCQKGFKEVSPSIFDLVAEQNLNRKEYIKRDLNALATSGTGGSCKISSETILSPSKYLSKDAFRFPLLLKEDKLLHKNFSYFFIKKTEKRKQRIQKPKSSWELIKETQDMLRKREDELQKNVNKSMMKIDKDEKKDISRKNEIKIQGAILQEDKINDSGIIDKRTKRSTVKLVEKGIKAPSEMTTKSGIKKVSKVDKNEESTSSKTAQREKEKDARRKDKENFKRDKIEQVSKEKDKKIMEIDQSKQKQSQQSEKKKANLGEQTVKKDNIVLPEKYSDTRKQNKLVENPRETIKDNQSKIDKDFFQRGNEVDEGKGKEISEQTREKHEISENKPEKHHSLPFGDEEQQKLEKKVTVTHDERKNKEEAALKFRALREIKSDPEILSRVQLQEIAEEPRVRDLNVDQIKISEPPNDNAMQFLKQTAKDKKQNNDDINIPLSLIVAHKAHKGLKVDSCAICNNSELELDIEEVLDKGEGVKISDIIIGQKICKYRHPLKSDDKQMLPLPIVVTTFNDELFNVPEKDVNSPEILEEKLKVSKKIVEPDVPKGVIRYALSDRTFIEKGWTMLPTEKVVRKMNVYRMRPAHPEFDWFEHNKNKKMMRYDTGEKLAEFDDNGRGRLYYRSGRLALDYYDAEEINAHQRFVIHSSGEIDARGCSRPLAILATFDYLGNGIVFDHTGKIRLKYNQTEGVVLDRSIGPVSHWKWHTLNDPPVLQQVMIDTQMAHKDPEILKLGGPQESKSRQDNEEMLAIEFDNFVKEKSKKLSQKFKPFQIKMKALKINEYFSLKVLDQATIYLIYRDGSTNIKINLGMILDHQEIVDTDTAEVGEVSNSLERFPARTDSLAGLQNSVAYAQRIERARVEREHRIRPTQPISSSDKLTAGMSRPLRVPVRVVTSESTVANCRCRKPPCNNLYYDTRFI
ncbi:uncharacterized protein LOC112053730 isoform X2 [Bicyclus anynana]|nr:uncharacterized protein LOC112053730 isoform X2 [Bicyclus anynana]